MVMAANDVAEMELTITNEVGLHARPAALLVQTAAGFPDTAIQVIKEDRSADAKSILQVLTLGATRDSQILIRAQGAQAEAALAAIRDLVERDFAE
jgi:PTS hybrid protein